MDWYIDSIDPRAGLAFASQRPAILKDNGEKDKGGFDKDSFTVFISPPYFQPEFGVGLSTAFSAARNSFQLGVFIDENELAFNDLSSVTEFVRRCYLNGGGGGDLGPESGPPPPTEGGPDLPAPSDMGDEGGSRELGIISSLKSSFEAIHSYLSDSKLGDSSKENPFKFAAIKSTGMDRDCLAVGAYLVLNELLRRYPAKNAQSLELQRWSDAAVRLVDAFDVIGIWPLLPKILSQNNGQLDNIVGSFAKYIDREDYYVQVRKRYGIEGDLLFLRSVFLLTANGIFWPPFFTLHFWGGCSSRARDPFEDLGYFPLPAEVTHTLTGGRETESEKNLCVYLSRVLGSPDVLQKDYFCMGILLFSAVNIVSQNNNIPRRLGARSFLIGLDRVDIEASFRAVDRLVEEAFEWIISNLPSYIFPRPVEEEIKSVISKKY